MRKTEYLVFGVGVLTACVSSFTFNQPAQASDESLTLETYYPAPYGSYAELTTTSNTYLATESGNVGVGTTNPQAKLEVTGGVKMGQDTAICDGSKEGTMRYNTTGARMEYCDGSSWQQMGIASTGLYGLCQIRNAGIEGGDCISICEAKKYPATCDFLNACTCPAGYTPVLLTLSGYCLAEGAYSCYKN